MKFLKNLGVFAMGYMAANVILAKGLCELSNDPKSKVIFEDDNVIVKTLSKKEKPLLATVIYKSINKEES